MAWRRTPTPPTTPPPPRSTLLALLPLFLLLLLVLLLALLLYNIYLSFLQIRSGVSSSLKQKNIAFTKEGGLRVGVRGLDNESYVDRTREGMVKAWNLSTWPGYRSRFWNKEKEEGGKGVKGRKGYTKTPVDVPAK